MAITHFYRASPITGLQLLAIRSRSRRDRNRRAYTSDVYTQIFSFDFERRNGQPPKTVTMKLIVTFAFDKFSFSYCKRNRNLFINFSCARYCIIMKHSCPKISLISVIAVLNEILKNVLFHVETMYRYVYGIERTGMSDEIIF